MAEVHQAPAGGKGGDPPAAVRCLQRLVEAAHALRDAWSEELDGATYPRSLPSFGGLVRELDVWLADAEARGAPLAEEAPVPAIDLAQREVARAWLADLRVQIDDALAAGEDATRPSEQRTLGRVTARGKIGEARHALGRLLAVAEGGLVEAERN